MNATTVVRVLSGPSGESSEFLRETTLLPSPLPLWPALSLFLPLLLLPLSIRCFGHTPTSIARRNHRRSRVPPCPCEARGHPRGTGVRRDRTWRGSIPSPLSERTIINRRLVYVAPRGSRWARCVCLSYKQRFPTLTFNACPVGSSIVRARTRCGFIRTKARGGIGTLHIRVQ